MYLTGLAYYEVFCLLHLLTLLYEYYLLFQCHIFPTSRRKFQHVKCGHRDVFNFYSLMPFLHWPADKSKFDKELSQKCRQPFHWDRSDSVYLNICTRQRRHCPVKTLSSVMLEYIPQETLGSQWKWKVAHRDGVMKRRRSRAMLHRSVWSSTRTIQAETNEHKKRSKRPVKNILLQLHVSQTQRAAPCQAYELEVDRATTLWTKFHRTHKTCATTASTQQQSPHQLLHSHTR